MEVPMTGIPEFLTKDPENLEQNDDGSVYIPIWQVEKDLDTISDGRWSRKNHKYSFHPISDASRILATSHELIIQYGGVERILLCSSLIDPVDYPGVKNLLQTGIAEATKAGVKILGKRFGGELNDRTVPKKVKNKLPVKVKPDKAVLTAYTKAVMDNDTKKIEQLLTRYDIKTEKDYAKS